MTTEQRISRLDKRIALFEQYLLLQTDILETKYSKNSDPFYKLKMQFSMDSRVIQAKSIYYQPIKPFASGGIVTKNPC